MEVVPDNNGYKSLIQIGTQCNPGYGRSEIFEEFCKELSPTKYEMMLEIIGCAMTRQGINPEKILVLVGRSNNGKSTFMRIVTECYGREVISNEDMYDIQNDRFSAVKLVGKIINIYSEMPSEVDMKGFNKLKTMTTSGELQSVQDKNDPRYNADITATMAFSCNELPNLPNHDEAIYKRLALIVFSKKFKKNNKFINQFLKEDEMIRILNSMIYFMSRIKDNDGSLTSPQSVEEVQELWKSHSDTTTLFITTKIRPVKVKEKEVSVAEMNTALIKFCTDLGKPQAMAAQFNAKMEKFGYEQKQTSVNNESLRVWRGITLIRTDDNQEILTKKTTWRRHKTTGNLIPIGYDII